jgi:hypothetical protein
VPPYGDIHHRSEALRGFSDASINATFEPARFNTGSSRWQLGLGLSLPTGDTVPDPIRLGRLGLRHEHLQFGIGTVAPRISVGWSRPVASMLLAGSIEAHLPLVENDEGFIASKSLQWTIGPVWTIRRVALALQTSGQYQTIARWSGEQDEGSGFINGGFRLQGSTLLPHGFSASAFGYLEAFSRSLHHETFRQSPTWGISLSRVF